ncbi:hypothetical protein [Aquimarina algiphila]|uniref:hypothetical protein n=1 Tax=Aquimarina algiphila TaxID=2047982 RepID=UPI00232B6283|nr:hypothetical protein [Aquimarina algiphila]
MCAKTPPPGTWKESISTNNSPAITLNFGSPSFELLPPLVKVSNWGSSPLKVDIIVFIDSIISSSSQFKQFIIYYERTTCEAGTPQLTIYISYDFKGIPGTPGTPSVPANPTSNSYVLHSIELSFDKKKYSFIESIQNVKTFLWNQDPETSRGTVTTVPPPTE